MKTASFPERSYRVLLRATPADFQVAHGAEAAKVFSELYRDAKSSGGGFAATGLWLRSVFGLILCACAEHFERFRNRPSARRDPSKRPSPKHIKLPSGKGLRNAPGNLRQNLHFTYRTMIRKPGFTIAAILILGVGIGATTAIFSVVDTVMLRPLPYPNPLRLVSIGYGGTQPRLFRQWNGNLQSFAQIAAATNWEVDLTSTGTPTRLRAAKVTEDFLPIFGATSHVGRTLKTEDYAGAFDTAVLGYGLWQRLWGGDSSLVGHQITVAGQPVVVVGVMSPDFENPRALTGSRVDIWLPLDVEAEEIQSWSTLGVVGRLNDESNLPAAIAEFNTLTENLAAEMPDALLRRDGSIRYSNLVPLHFATFRGVGRSLIFLMGAVLLMLLIACANVANLLLAQGTTRTHEIGLRCALGASRGRIVSQLLTESACLGLVGGVLGVILAFGGVSALAQHIPVDVPRMEHLSVDLRVLVFALCLSLITGVVFGLLPAVLAVRRDAIDALKQGASSISSSRSGGRARSVLFVAEIALALFLLTGASLFFRTLVALNDVDPGLASEQLVTVPLPLGDNYSDQDRLEIVRETVRRIETIPGTESAAAGLTVPFEYTGASKCCIWNEVEGENTPREGLPLNMVMTHPVTPRYFQTLGARVSHGREFLTADGSGEGNVAIVNERTARYFFATTDAVGRTIRIGNHGPFTIVGVVSGVHHWGISQGLQYGVYIPWSRWGKFASQLQILVRSTTETSTLAPILREAIWSVDPRLPVEEIVPMSRRVDASLAGQRAMANLLGIFAAIALALACGGVYASMLHMVGQRRHEMGVRLALGARSTSLVKLVLKSCLTLTALGIAAGTAGSLAGAKIISSMVWGVSVTDATSLAGMAAVVFVVALGACVVPAIRAARTDPLQTLRVE